jgi:type II secretory pathway pseudopilin PulG
MKRTRAPRDAGFTYVGLIVLVAIIGLVGAATLKVDALLRRAAAEQELLEIGAAFSAALRSYADATPRGQPPYPPSLQELLKDPRSPAVLRHLRKIFVDPVTGKATWGIVHAGNDSGVLAVYSLSTARPLKIANFDARFANLESREHLSDWKFAALGQGVAQPGQHPEQAAPAAPAPASLFPEKAAGAVPPAPPVEPAPVPVPPVEEPPPVSPPQPQPSEASSAGDDKGEQGDEEEVKDDSRAKRDRQAAPTSSDTR